LPGQGSLPSVPRRQGGGATVAIAECGILEAQHRERGSCARAGCAPGVREDGPDNGDHVFGTEGVACHGTRAACARSFAPSRSFASEFSTAFFCGKLSRLTWCAVDVRAEVPRRARRGGTIMQRWMARGNDCAGQCNQLASSFFAPLAWVRHCATPLAWVRHGINAVMSSLCADTSG
jgi:hypothetical protein